MTQLLGDIVIFVHDEVLVEDLEDLATLQLSHGAGFSRERKGGGRRRRKTDRWREGGDETREEEDDAVKKKRKSWVKRGGVDSKCDEKQSPAVPRG